MFRTISRYLKRLNDTRKREKARHISDYRATALAVKLVLSGALTSCNRGVSIVSLKQSRQNREVKALTAL